MFVDATCMLIAFVDIMIVSPFELEVTPNVGVVADAIFTLLTVLMMPLCRLNGAFALVPIHSTSL